MVSQCFLPGTSFADGDTNEVIAEIDYPPVSSSVVSPLWSSASTADPLKDLKTAMRLVSGACGYSADLIVMGKDASDAFENADKVLAAYDKQHISPGQSRLSLPNMESRSWATIVDFRSTPANRNTPMSMAYPSISFQRTRCWSPRRDCKALSRMLESFRWTRKNPPCILTRRAPSAGLLREGI